MMVAGFSSALERTAGERTKDAPALGAKLASFSRPKATGSWSSLPSLSSISMTASIQVSLTPSMASCVVKGYLFLGAPLNDQRAYSVVLSLASTSRMMTFMGFPSGVRTDQSKKWTSVQFESPSEMLLTDTTGASTPSTRYSLMTQSVARSSLYFSWASTVWRPGVRTSVKPCTSQE